MKVFEPLPLALLPIAPFWPAEDYHQDYAKNNPVKYGYYRTGSGRTNFINNAWGDRVSEFDVPPLESAGMKKLEVHNKTM